MSKLPNAPLLEVIFELRWKVLNQNDLTKSQYLHGDLYSILKSDYPFRELLTPPEVPSAVLINKPVYRFRKAKDDYPLIQIGPGVLTLNTTDDEYFWDNYYKSADLLLKSFSSVHTMNPKDMFTPSLAYIDFFKISPTKDNLLSFINKNLNIKIEQGFFKEERKPSVFNFGLNFNIDFGNLSINLNTGMNGNKEPGLILQTKIIGRDLILNPQDILAWLSNAHELCSRLFKNMTKGQLYESFKKD